MDKRVRFRCGTAYDTEIKAASVNPIIKCPVCRTKSPFEFCGDGVGKYDDEINYIVQCCSCDSFLLARFRYYKQDDHLGFVDVFPYGTYKNTFPSDFAEVSKRFINTYEQAMTAKELHLDELVGMGLRKALEFLIYDYIKNVLAIEPAKTLEKRIEQIKIQNIDVNGTLVRWVGNDHTHVELKHPEFTIDEMIQSIDLIVYYLYAEYKSKKVAEKIKVPQPPQ